MHKLLSLCGCLRRLLLFGLEALSNQLTRRSPWIFEAAEVARVKGFKFEGKCKIDGRKEKCRTLVWRDALAATRRICLNSGR
ncbi:uncharacterized protein B0H18DRAFT_49132 [Fomitopsis serialis]|uniref:uncharacterized protein n=1 Tax=Fomitopsis serialis TaxID=139415 RepID=UPI0020081A02|nr:uncharacterized protein B0H18DRAFT_49132 [Neoantrodia serialis]KAH9932174.1 hypothetical protein B0H18DRAFT_49132 [Neoantrodia serialis]